MAIADRSKHYGNVGKVQRLPLREVWTHEALGFTCWLEGNVDVLSDVLGIKLNGIEREHDAGDFSVDLVAKTDSGDVVVIENQLGKSDHDHLGKLLTYLSSLDAKVAVWVVATPRPEHVRAVDWLNQSELAEFYLVKLEAIKIGESAPAPWMTLITGPSEETVIAGRKKKELTEQDNARLRFLSGLLDRARVKTRLHANIAPSTGYWVGASAGRSGLSLNYVILQKSARVELYIDFDQTGEGNKAMFDAIEAQKESVENEFKSPIKWERLDDARACRISTPIDAGGLQNESLWPALQDTMIETMICFDRVFRPRWEKLL